MEVSRPAIVITLDDDDAQILGRLLKTAVHRAWLDRGVAAPHILLELTDAINRAARTGSGPGTGNGRPGAVPEPRNTPDLPDLAACGHNTMSVSDAATAARVSPSYVRRLIRDGLLDTAPRRPDSPYRLYADSVQAWTSRRTRAGER